MKCTGQVRGYRRVVRDGLRHEVDVLAEVEITIDEGKLIKELGENAIRNGDRKAQAIRGAVKAKVLRDITIDGEQVPNE